MSSVVAQRDVDREAVEAVLAGDPTAYRALVERYQGRVFTIVCGMVRDREEAKDLTQEAFVKAYNNLSRYRTESSFYTWLYRIAMNVTIDHIRKHGKRQREEYDDSVAAHDPDGSPHSGHSSGDPAKLLVRKQLHNRIMAALDTLSPEHRQIILLREVDGLSYKEIADALDLAEGTVMSRLFYARKKLQELLKDELPAR